MLKNRKISAIVRISLKIVAIFLVAISLSVFVLRWVNPPITAFMIHKKLHTSAKNQNRNKICYKWVDLASISPHMAFAVISAEDQSFATHWGFDFESIGKAVQHNKSRKRVRGASTLTQQVAKNLYLWPQRSYLRKTCEAYFTLLIEVFWPKKRILEMYLNIAEFGDGIYGVGAACQEYFGKPPAYLTLQEAALLGAVLPNPARYKIQNPSERLIQRQEWIVDQCRLIEGDAALRRIIYSSRNNHSTRVLQRRIACKGNPYKVN